MGYTQINMQKTLSILIINLEKELLYNQHMEYDYHIDRYNIIATHQVGDNSLLVAIPRDGSEFAMNRVFAIKKLEAMVEMLSDMDIDTQLLGETFEPKTGDTVEIECDGTDSVIKWLRWKNEWYIADIIEEPVNSN